MIMLVYYDCLLLLSNITQINIPLDYVAMKYEKIILLKNVI